MLSDIDIHFQPYLPDHKGTAEKFGGTSTHTCDNVQDRPKKEEKRQL